MAELQRLIEQCTAEEREQLLFAAYYVAFTDACLCREKPLLDRIGRELNVLAKTIHRHMCVAQWRNWRHRQPKLTVPERQVAR